MPLAARCSILIEVPTVISSPSQQGCSARNAAVSINRIISGVEYTGGNSGWCEVSVCLNSTVSSASPRAPIGISLATALVSKKEMSQRFYRIIGSNLTHHLSSFARLDSRGGCLHIQQLYIRQPPMRSAALRSRPSPSTACRLHSRQPPALHPSSPDAPQSAFPVACATHSSDARRRSHAA